jgi:hypothetical protein
MEHVYFSYNGFRGLLMWNHAPSKNKSKLFVWDMSVYFDSKRKQDYSEPTLVLQFPYENMSQMVFPGTTNQLLKRVSPVLLRQKRVISKFLWPLTTILVPRQSIHL